MRLVKVWIQGSCFVGDIRAMLARYSATSETKFRPSSNIYSSDVVLYTGGSDISPELYGEKTLPSTSVNHRQDTDDLSCWNVARRARKYQVGICRGAQLLNALNGGRLWQHVDNHAGANHEVIDTKTNQKYMVSSLHHQGIRLSDSGRLLAFTHRATKKFSDSLSWTSTLGNGSFVSSNSPDVDVEAFYYPGSRCLGVQWHPELGPQECVDWFFRYFEEYQEIPNQKVA